VAKIALEALALPRGGAFGCGISVQCL